MPKDVGGCDGCGRRLLNQGALTRGCRRCNFDLCEPLSSSSGCCKSRCPFGTPFNATVHLEGPALSFKFTAANVLLDAPYDDGGIWTGRDGRSWFILDLGSVRSIGAFELRNTSPDGRYKISDACTLEIARQNFTTEYTIEVADVLHADLDRTKWRTAHVGKLENTPKLVQVPCPAPVSSARFVKFSGDALRYFAALDRQIEPPSAYVCSPAPPRFLWDTGDSQFLDRVTCHAMIRVAALHPKTASFTLRMKCHWAFRTPNLQQDSEMQLRGVPGIRMPALSVTVEESRVWKDLTSDASNNRTTQKSVYWKGTSTLLIEGCKNFHMEDFPFDRQIINLEHFHFVWRSHKDHDDYFKSMKVASFTAETVSMLSEWKTEPVYILPVARFVTVPEEKGDPSHASKFIVKVRLEHEHLFYVWQVCFPAYLMTLVSCTPLAMPPGQDDMGDRLAVYTGGLLTLVTFKYGVADHLPSVPYRTFIDNYLRGQVMAITFCALESVVSFHLILRRNNPFALFGLNWNLDDFENGLFYVMIGFWSMRFLHARFFMPSAKKSWSDVWAQKHQHKKDADHFEFQDADEFEFSAEEEQPGIVAGTVVINKRESLPVWDASSGEELGFLNVEQSLKARGAPFSSEAEKYARRFLPREDKLLTEDGVIELYKEKSRSEEDAQLYWTQDCKARMLVPIVLPIELEKKDAQEVRVLNGDEERGNGTAQATNDPHRHAAVELAHVRVLTEEEDPHEVWRRQREEDCHAVRREFFWNSNCLIS